ncbi:hypothetical protein HDR59_02370 [bacterium]|nr:hypothetical protein [bacterium]
MKKILLASLLVLTVLSVDVMAKGGKGKGNKKTEGTTERKEKGDRKGPTFENGCLVVDENAKGPMADMSTKADADGDGCITEEEFKTYMENNKPEGGRGHGPKGERPEGMPPKAE